MYLKVKAYTVCSLAKAEHFAFTTDLWASHTRHHYMALTAPPSWEIKAENDQEAVVCVTIDNATNMKTALKSLLPSTWITCF